MVYNEIEYKRGDLCYINKHGEGLGSEQMGERPAVIVQNNVGNKFSSTVIVAYITKNVKRIDMPTHVEINTKESKLPENSIIMLEQLRTVDKMRISRKLSTLSESTMNKVDEALAISIGIHNDYR